MVRVPRRMLEVEVDGDWKPSHKAGFVKVFVPGRWFRIGLTFGAPPGSRIGVWRTRSYGLRGINLRIGRRYAGPCLTIMAHTRSTDRVRAFAHEMADRLPSPSDTP